jgi:hypothetical protein
MSDKKEYIVFDEEGLHEYNVTKEQTDKGIKLSLYHSNGSQWNEHARGELLLTMTDDGNGVSFDRKIKDVSYSELLHIRILLNIRYQTEDSEPNREKLIAVEKSVTLIV